MAANKKRLVVGGPLCRSFLLQISLNKNEKSSQEKFAEKRCKIMC
jgi:hypothetical protein